MASASMVKRKARDSLDEVDSKGAFKRTDSAWRHSIEDGGRFSPAEGRYHLYVALACPWADGVLAALFLKGLEHAIGYSVVHPTWQRTKPEDESDTHSGWVFRRPGDAPLSNSLGHGSFPCDEALIPDSVNGCKTVRELYEKAGDTFGKYTTPLLWDRQEGTIVNNESLDILKMFSDNFNSFAAHPKMELFPAHLVEQAAEANSWIYPSINNGVYRCGFAKTQEAYDEAVHELFSALDRAEELLGKQRYVLGAQFTYMDIRLFNTLVRFDPVYVVYFKTNKCSIESNYANLFSYIRDVYQMPGVGRSINMQHTKMHYFTSHPHLNPFGVIPAGRDMQLDGPHDRNRFT